MEIRKAKFQNLLTLGSAELELSKRGLLLVQGQNNDDTSAMSNGAGKSSITDGICWTIYGTTARGVTGDSVVNNKIKKDCMGEVEIEDGAAQYRVTRYRKDATHKNQVFVHRFNDASGNWEDISKGTDKETQEVINTLMGCSLEVFQAAIYIGQEEMVDLPALTDKQLKLLVEEAAGVQELAAAYDYARAEMNEAKMTVTRREGELAAAQQSKTTGETMLADIKLREDEFEAGRKGRATAEVANVPTLKKALETYEAQLAAIDQASLTAERDKLAAELTGHNAHLKEHRRLISLANDATNDHVRAQGNEARAKDALRKAMAELKGVDDLVGQPCGSCGKAYCEHDLEEVRKLRQQAQDNAAAEARKTVAATATAKKAAEEAIATAESYHASIPDISVVAARHADITNELNHAGSLQSEIKRHQAAITQAMDAGRLRLTEPNPYKGQAESMQLKIDGYKTAIESAEKALEAAQTDLNVANDVVSVFGPAGVRALILDTVTPYLNDRTSEYLAALSDGNIHAIWSTLTRTAKGDPKEKFNIEVVNDSGADSYKGLSGGEKRKVRLSTAMALQDMVASRATKPINLFAADEIDDSLDEAGLERLMGVLERKARERGTVMVISHNSLSDWIDNVILVEKKGKVSTVSGATHV